jgi:cytochrome P450
MKNDEFIPTLPSNSIFGHLSSWRDDRIGLQRRMLASGAGLLAARVSVIEALFVNSPEYAQEVLVDRAADYKKSRGLSLFARPLIGDGLLASHGEQHKKQRALIAPAFHAKKISRYAEVIVEEAEAAARSFSDGRELDLAHEMMRLTLTVVARTLFHTTVAADVEAVSEAFTAVSRSLIGMIAATLPLPPEVPTRRAREMKRAIAALDRIIFRIIAERRSSGEDPGDVLSMLLEGRDEASGEAMSDGELRNEIMTLFLAGHETTGNALTWAFYLLTRHPEVYDRLATEADEVLGGRSATFADLPRLPFAMAVFKESMRLYPPAYIIGRLALKDTKIARYEVEKGRTVFINIWGLHHDPRTWREPERFLPERFMDGAEKNMPKGAYMPFGGGPRICVGNHFALMEGQLSLATLAQRVRFVARDTEEIEPEPLITLRPKRAVSMRAEPRSASPSGMLRAC